MRKTFFIGTASILLAGAAVAQGGDDCSVATAINTTGTFAWDTTIATTSGFDGGGSCATGASTINQDLFWQWTAPASADYQFDTDTSSFDTKISVHAGVGCAATCTAYDDDGGIGTQSLTTVSGVTAGDMFLIQVGGFGTNSGIGNLNISTFIDPCTAGDALEDNDTCATAATISANGTTAGLSVNNSDPDFYSVVVPAGEILTVDHAVSQGFLDFRVFDSACNYYRNETFDFRWANGSGAPQTVVFEVFNTSTSVTCALYDLILSTAPDVCAGPDDTFEENDDCTTAVAIAPGSYPGLYVSLADRDFYSISVPNGMIADIDLAGTSVDVDFELRDMGCAMGVTSLAGDDFEFSNLTGSTVTLIFEAVIDPSLTQAACSNYDLTVALLPDPCFAAMDDTFEDNDTCATAAPITVGSYPGLFIDQVDLDFYTIDVPAGMILDVDLLAFPGFDIDFFVFAGGCGAVPTTPTDDFEVPNPGPGVLTVIFQAEADPIASSPSCTTYDIAVALVPDPCFGIVPDTFEDNDDCATATVISDGTYAGLNIQDGDGDNFAFCVADGATVNCDILFIDAIADVDFFLREASSTFCGTGNGSEELADGFSVTDNETLSWTNTTGANVDVVLEVDMFTTGGCNDYDLVISGSGCGDGSTFCDPNSLNCLGVSTTLSGNLGSGVGSGLHLTATNGPSSEFGYFLVSSGMDPVGITLSRGQFCLFDGTTTFGRYNVIGGTANSVGQFSPDGLTFNNLVGTGTSASNTGFDVPVTVPISGSPMIMAGQTWNFQLWHRDAACDVAGSSNFSNALSVVF